MVNKAELVIIIFKEMKMHEYLLLNKEKYAKKHTQAFKL